jgi:hypothetical protein
MTKTPMITSVTGRTQSNTEKWPFILLFECQTEDGPLVLQATSAAAHQLRSHLENLPPSFGERPDLRKL